MPLPVAIVRCSIFSAACLHGMNLITSPGKDQAEKDSIKKSYKPIVIDNYFTFSFV